LLLFLYLAVYFCFKICLSELSCNWSNVCVGEQTVKDNPSLLLPHSDSKQRSVVDGSDDKKDVKKKKTSGVCL